MPNNPDLLIASYVVAVLILADVCRDALHRWYYPRVYARTLARLREERADELWYQELRRLNADALNRMATDLREALMPAMAAFGAALSKVADSLNELEAFHEVP